MNLSFLLTENTLLLKIAMSSITSASSWLTRVAGVERNDLSEVSFFKQDHFDCLVHAYQELVHGWSDSPDRGGAEPSWIREDISSDWCEVESHVNARNNGLWLLSFCWIKLALTCEKY